MEELECRVCFQYLPEDNFYFSPKYPKKRYHRCYWCIDCFREKSKIHRKKMTPQVESDYDAFLRIMKALGYDTTDLKNNSIHSQFMMKYGDKLKDTPKRSRKKKGGY